MKKWIITILLAVTLLALALATHFWGARVIKFAVDSDKTVDSLKRLLEVLLTAVGLAVPVVKWLAAKKDVAPSTIAINSRADHDLNIGGNIQTGGISAHRNIGDLGEVTNQQHQPGKDRQSFFPDLPSKIDYLDFMPYARALADLIGSKSTETPLTLGILGSWGSGKTTLMHFIEEALSSRSDAPVLIRFHAWKYDKEDALWRAMLLSVLETLRRQLPTQAAQPQVANPTRRDPPSDPSAEIERLQQSLYRDVDWQEKGGLIIDWPQALKGVAGGALKLTFSLVPGLNAAAALTEAVKSARGSVAEGKLAKDLADVASALKRDVIQHRQEQLRSTEQFQSQFRRLVNEHFKDRRIIIFVDDLDRCLPEKAVDVLEAIKLFLDVEGCVFVLAVDSQVISRGIQVKYKDFTETLGPDMAVDGDLYLGKIIQLPFLLPPIETDDMRHYVQSFNADWPDARCQDIFAEGLAPNPRQVKRTINVFLLLWKLAESRKTKLGAAITPLRLAKIVALQTAHPQVFELLKQNPSLLAELEAHCRALAGGEVKGKTPVKVDPVLQKRAPEAQRLLGLFYDDEAARFGELKEEDLACFFTLTKRVQDVAPPTELPSPGSMISTTAAPVSLSPPAVSIEQPSTEPAALTPRFQLPPPPADFTGRGAELAELRAAVDKGGIHIVGLHGQGGVGKTALALKLAEDLAPNYPDAQIYLDLKGVSEKPLTAAEAMSHVLRTFHPEAKLPEKEEELRAQYLSTLHSKRALLLMDNAKDAAQVRPLIPPPGCTLIVTSRNRFALPGLFARNLDTLPPSDAKALLLGIAPRIGGEAEAIGRLCAYLPRALQLAATAIAEHADLSPADYRQKLADEKQRLKLLSGEEGVEASITLSYNLLDPQTQQRWRMLAVFSETFDAPAAAVLWETETDAAQETLSRLLQHSMIEWNEATKRYRLHDLMRDFARQRQTSAESDAAARHHAKHYGAVLAIADNLYLKGGESFMRGLALFDLDWGNIQAGQNWAASHAAGDGEAAKLCSCLPDWGTYILSLRQHPRDRIRWLETALTAARDLEDRAAESRHLDSLGQAYADLGDYPGNKLVDTHVFLWYRFLYGRHKAHSRAENAARGDCLLCRS